jgi:hypothetical protein
MIPYYLPAVYSKASKDCRLQTIAEKMPGGVNYQRGHRFHVKLIFRYAQSRPSSASPESRAAASR